MPSRGEAEVPAVPGKGAASSGSPGKAGTFISMRSRGQSQLPVLEVVGGVLRLSPSSRPGSVSGVTGQGKVKGQVETMERSA